MRDVATGPRVATLSSSSVSQSKRREKERESVAGLFCHLDLITDHSIAAALRRARRELTRRHAATGASMRATFPKARKHLALSIETPSLPELSASPSHTNRPSSLQKRLLLAFYLFGLTLWMVCAWTMRLSWLAVAVVVVATLTAGVIWRRVVPSWLAFMVMTLWGGLPFEIDRSKSRPCVLELALWGNL